jgi:peptidoglycan/xylan/chitin deacetylase (PgdA/CDA1 family)
LKARHVAIWLTVVAALLAACGAWSAGDVVYNGPTNRKAMALTFDLETSPANWVKELQILKAEGVKGTAFFLGNAVGRNPAYVKAWADAGMEVGTHSLSHPQFTKLDESGQKWQLARSLEVISQATGSRTAPLFRPPYGSFDATTKAVCSELGLRIIHWNMDTRDWTGRSSSQIVSYVLSKAHNGAIVLMHDRGSTVNALRAIVRGLRGKGYQLVTVSQLLGNKPIPKPPTQLEVKTMPTGAKVYVRPTPDAAPVLKGVAPCKFELSSLNDGVYLVEFVFDFHGQKTVRHQQVKAGALTSIAAKLATPVEGLLATARTDRLEGPPVQPLLVPAWVTNGLQCLYLPLLQPVQLPSG